MSNLIHDFDAFCELAKDNDIVPVYRRLISDSLTPVSAFRRVDTGGNACLFESVIGGEKVGRFSFIAIDPIQTISAYGNTLWTVIGNEKTEETVDDPIAALRERLRSTKMASVEGLKNQPFVGGAIGYAGYDVIRYAEHLPNAPHDDRKIPDLSFSFYDRMVVFDNVTKTMIVIGLARIQPDQDLKQIYDDTTAKVDKLVEDLGKPEDGLTLSDIDVSPKTNLEFRSNFTQNEFEAAVEKCVEYIRAGDIFQVVLSQRLDVDYDEDPFEIYRTLRIVNPSPFMFFLRTPETTLIGSSPEIMCRVVDGIVTVRPLAGTRPRGRTDEEDQALADELLADPKERAEHVMLVDLGRNDVGRIAKYRSVKLSDVMTIERYSHVMHITSNVNGELMDDKDAFDALQASLPAGTVSGAPKVRAMEIIDELEPNRRGPYAGAVGYIDFNGNMDTCIALRTMVLHEKKAYVQAGAGIVADSNPESEYMETLNKARGLLRAIEITKQRTAR